MDSTNSSPKKDRTPIIVVGGCLLMLVCLACILVAGIATYLISEEDILADILTPAGSVSTPTTVPTTAPILSRETPTPRGSNEIGGLTAANPTPTPMGRTTVTAAPTGTAVPLLTNIPDSINQAPVNRRAAQDLQRLFSASYPAQDYFAINERLGQESLGPRTTTVPPYSLGDRQQFWVDEEQIEAELLAINEFAYFWVEEGLNLPQAALNEAATRLEVEFYPRLETLFGREWQPGVDNDPRFTLLHISGSTDLTEYGFFTSIDEFPTSLFPTSNQQEMIYLNMSELEVGSELYYGTMVHELQHLIQWHIDPNERTWLNEGLSQLAEIYLGFDTAISDDYFFKPEIQLNGWDSSSDDVFVHYSAAYLFSVYLWEQLGETAVQELARHPADGMAAVNNILAGYAPERPLSHFVADWAIANLINNAAVAPQYAYDNIQTRRIDFTDGLREATYSETHSLNQFGVNYFNLDFRGQATINFAGDSFVRLIDTPPRTGEQFWFAPPVNESVFQLTGAFDLSGLSTATLQFATWFDLEEDFDFAYVSISADGGATWDILVPTNRRAGEFGPAFNGYSGDDPDAVNGWLKERISLNGYVGQQVLIRFEVITDFEVDAASLGRGFAIDDITIPELDFVDDVEGDSSVWTAVGFIQTGWQLPQQWQVRLVTAFDSATPQVETLSLNALNQGQWPIEISKGNAVLVIMPLTPFVDDPANYWLQIESR